MWPRRFSSSLKDPILQPERPSFSRGGDALPRQDNPMFKVTRQIHFCYGHRLLHYNGKCSYLHGHNGRLEIELQSNRLDRRGMVFDFKDIKEVIQGWIDKNLDHRMILHHKRSEEHTSELQSHF